MGRSHFIDRILTRKGKLPRDQLEEILRQVAEERDQLQVIFDSMLEGVFVAGEDGLGLFINHTATQLLDVREEEFLGNSVLPLLPGGEFRELTAGCLHEKRRVLREEITVSSPIDRLMELTVMPLVDRSGGTAGIVSLFHDITQKKLLENELKRTQKLADMTTLAAQVSHEIRNPLNNLQIYTQLAQRDLKKVKAAFPDGTPQPDSDPIGPALEKLSVVREEVGRLNDVLENFLAAVRPMKPVLEDVDLVDLVEGTLRVMGPDLEAKRIQVDLETDPERIPPILADGARLRLAIRNLLKNAAEAVGKDGRIRISIHSNRGYMVLKVADNGPGIPEEIRERVFDAYFTTKEGGTGLGLVTVCRVVEDHGGVIRLETDPGSGTEFTIRLPRRRDRSRMLPLATHHRTGPPQTIDAELAEEIRIPPD